MLRLLLLSVSLSCLAPLATAQTIGIPGANDLEVTMPPSLPVLAGSSTTSCFVVPGGAHSATNAGVLQYRVNSNATPTDLAVVFLSFCPPCGGAVNFGFPTAPPCAGANGPLCTLATPLTNRCLSLDFSCGFWTNVPMINAGAGFFHVRIPIPPSNAFPTTLWAQALITHSGTCHTLGWHLSQAIGIN
jgi:hypothetical protein